jgi:hypothetical protein
MKCLNAPILSKGCARRKTKRLPISSSLFCMGVPLKHQREFPSNLETVAKKVVVFRRTVWAIPSVMRRLKLISRLTLVKYDSVPCKVKQGTLQFRPLSLLEGGLVRDSLIGRQHDIRVLDIGDSVCSGSPMVYDDFQKSIHMPGKVSHGLEHVFWIRISRTLQFRIATREEVLSRLSSYPYMIAKTNH